MSYEKWRRRLAGEKVEAFTQPDSDDAGFYRKPIKERKPNGQWRTTGFIPVAIFFEGEKLFGMIGDKQVDQEGLDEAWGWIVAHPISEEMYRAVSERGEPWPDFEPEKPEDPATSLLTEDAKLALALIEAKAKLPDFAKIESDEQSSKARGLQQRFLDIRGDAKREYEKANRPLLDEQKRLRSIWSPLQDAADECSLLLRNAMGVWEDFKREQARKAQAEADRIARAHEDEVRMAEAANRPAPPPIAAPKPNAPPPAAQIKAAGARTANVTVKKFVTDIDIDKAFAQFRNEIGLKLLLIDFAQKAVNAGLTVEGAIIEERSIVK